MCHHSNWINEVTVMIFVKNIVCGHESVKKILQVNILLMKVSGVALLL